MEDSTPRWLSSRLREAGVLAEGAVASLIVTAEAPREAGVLAEGAVASLIVTAEAPGGPARRWG